MLVVLAAAAILVPLAIVRTADQARPATAKIVRPQRVVPKTVVPQAEPVIFQAVAPEDARAFNATIPFSTGPNPAARPFRISGSPEDEVRAIDCLAAAVIYEAGDDTDGGRAVAQVVLNRMRHPAFPKSVCGVVFQGSERRTGCQFTFTCDGALMRQISPAAWGRAREVARAALNGSVDPRVGHATHYHTDWVVPYWSSSLDKITEVKTHLFFRWTGWWGTPPAFGRRYAGAEPMIPKMARLSSVHGPLTDLATGEPVVGGIAITGEDPRMAGREQENANVLHTLELETSPAKYPEIAQQVCGERPYCRFMAWRWKLETPTTLPLSATQQRSMAFSYLRDRTRGFEKASWNCAVYRAYRASAPERCMPEQPASGLAPTPPAELRSDPAPKALRDAGAGAGRERTTAVTDTPDARSAPRQRSERNAAPLIEAPATETKGRSPERP